MSAPSRKGISSRSGLVFAVGGVVLIVALFFIGWHMFQRTSDAPKPPPDMVKVMEFNTRGVGYMEQFRYADAEAEFAKITDAAPDWLPGHINLAMALFNQNTQDKINRAI